MRRDPKDETSLISTLTPAQIEQLKEDGVIAGGMIPKVDSALEALAGGVAKVHFLDGQAGALAVAGTFHRRRDWHGNRRSEMRQS